MTHQQGSLLAPDPTLNGRGRAHRDAGISEREAAEAIRPVSGNRRTQLLRAYIDAGARGCADFEAARCTRMRRSAICGRRSELMALKLVELADFRRVDPDSQMRVNVYRVTETGRGAL